MTEPVVTPDDLLVRRAQSGETDAFQRLVMKHQDKIFTIIMRSVGDRAVAEELAQDTFVKAYCNIKRFQFRSEFSTWLTRIALNNTNSYFNSKRYKQQSQTSSLQMNHTAALANPSDDFPTETDIKNLHLAIGKLKPILRDALVLCALDGNSYESAAEILALPIGTVRSRLHEARKQLRALLVQQEAV